MPRDKEEVKEEKPKKERKGKKPKSKSKHRNVQIWKKYKGTERIGKFCPRCGAGCFLAEHGNRITCGRCHYSEQKIEKK